MSDYINQSSCQQTKKAYGSEKARRWNDQIFRGEGSHTGPQECWAKEGPLKPNHPRTSAATLLHADGATFTLWHLAEGIQIAEYPSCKFCWLSFSGHYPAPTEMKTDITGTVTFPWIK